MIAKVPKVRKAEIPLKYYDDFSVFRLFLSDPDLMGAMADVPVSEILKADHIFEEYKGNFTELYVFQQFQSSIDHGIFYDSAENSQTEQNFLLQKDSHLIPAEVKAEENLQVRPLRLFAKNYPESLPVRVSMSPCGKQDRMINLPLYAVNRIIRAVDTE